MKIRNGEKFSKEVNDALKKYYAYILKQELEYYRELPQYISRLEKNISHLENKIYYAEQLAEWMEKHEDGSLFDMFIGCYAPDLREYVDEKENELTGLYNSWQEKISFYEAYTNLLNNGLLIKEAENGCFDVAPYDNGLYMVMK